jgi:hypothetical protein
MHMANGFKVPPPYLVPISVIVVSFVKRTGANMRSSEIVVDEKESMLYESGGSAKGM